MFRYFYFYCSCNRNLFEYYIVTKLKTLGTCFISKKKAFKEVRSDRIYALISWTCCYDDKYSTHLSEKEESNYWPHKAPTSKPKYKITDDRNYQHQFTSWRECPDPYCCSHLDSKTKKLSHWAPPADYSDIWKAHYLEQNMQENPKAYDPSYIKIYDEEASNQEGAFCTKYVKKVDFAKSGPSPDLETTQDANKLWNLMLTAFARKQEEKSKNMNTSRN